MGERRAVRGGLYSSVAPEGRGAGLGAQDQFGMGVFHGGRIQGTGGEFRLGQLRHHIDPRPRPF